MTRARQSEARRTAREPFVMACVPNRRAVKPETCRRKQFEFRVRVVVE